MRILIVILLGLITTGCFPVTMGFLSYAKLSYDAVAILENEKTMTDEVVSAVVKQECDFFNILKLKPYCVKKLQNID